MKRIIATLLAGAALLGLVGCGGGSSANDNQNTEPKDYVQIIHDARSEEDNQYNMIFTEKDGKYTVQYGGAEDMEPEQAESSARDMLMPLLGLEPEMYQDFAASVSAMIVRSYGIAIVKPAEGKTQDVVDALQAFVDGQRQTMENYLMDQYEIAKAAQVKTLSTGEVVLVCCENSDQVLANIEKALAA